MSPRKKKNIPGSGMTSAFLTVVVVFWIFSQVGDHRSRYAQGGLAVTGVHVLDGLTGQRSGPHTVWMRDGIIQKIQDPADPLPPDVDLLDGSGGTLVPGLIDTATFLSLAGQLPVDARAVSLESSLRHQLKAGVTTVFDLNCARPLQRDFRLKTVAKPESHVYFAGPVFTGPDGWRPPGRTPWEYNVIEVSAMQELDEAWHSHVSFGYDLCFVSLEHPGLGHSAMDAELLQSLAARASQREIPLIIHTTTSGKMEKALSVSPSLIIGSPRSQVLDHALFTQMRDKGVAWAPALSEVLNLWPLRPMSDELEKFDLVGSLAGEVRRSLLDAKTRRQFTDQLELAEADRDLILQNVRNAQKAGVRLVAASMAGLPGVPHGRGLHREMAWLAEAGLSAPQLAVAATGGAAESVGLKRRGRIRPGYVADMVLIAGDPSRDPSAMRLIQAVIVAGQWVDRSKL